MQVTHDTGRTLVGRSATEHRLLGAVVYFLAKDVLGNYANHWMAIFGIALITVIVFSPTGIAGALQHLFKGRKATPAARKSAAH